MKIDVPDHALAVVAARVASVWRERNDAWDARDERTLERAKAFLDGVAVLSDWMGPQQRREFDVLCVEALERSKEADR